MIDQLLSNRNRQLELGGNQLRYEAPAVNNGKTAYRERVRDCSAIGPETQL